MIVYPLVQRRAIMCVTVSDSPHQSMPLFPYSLDNRTAISFTRLMKISIYHNHSSATLETLTFAERRRSPGGSHICEPSIGRDFATPQPNNNYSTHCSAYTKVQVDLQQAMRLVPTAFSKSSALKFSCMFTPSCSSVRQRLAAIRSIHAIPRPWSLAVGSQSLFTGSPMIHFTLCTTCPSRPRFHVVPDAMSAESWKGLPVGEVEYLRDDTLWTVTILAASCMSQPCSALAQMASHLDHDDGEAEPEATMHSTGRRGCMEDSQLPSVLVSTRTPLRGCRLSRDMHLSARRLRDRAQLIV